MHTSVCAAHESLICTSAAAGGLRHATGRHFSVAINGATKPQAPDDCNVGDGRRRWPGTWQVWGLVGTALASCRRTGGPPPPDKWCMHATASNAPGSAITSQATRSWHSWACAAPLSGQCCSLPRCRVPPRAHRPPHAPRQTSIRKRRSMHQSRSCMWDAFQRPRQNYTSRRLLPPRPEAVPTSLCTRLADGVAAEAFSAGCAGLSPETWLY